MSVEICSATFSECVPTGWYKKIIVCLLKVLNWAFREISKIQEKINYQIYYFCVCITSNIGFFGMQNSFVMLFFKFEIYFRCYWVIFVIMTDTLNNGGQNYVKSHQIQNSLHHWCNLHDCHHNLLPYLCHSVTYCHCLHHLLWDSDFFLTSQFEISLEMSCSSVALVGYFLL